MANTIFRDQKDEKKNSDLLSRPSDRARSITRVQRIFLQLSNNVSVPMPRLYICTYGRVAPACLIAARRMSDNRLSKNLPVSDVTFAHVMGIVATRERALTLKKQECVSMFKSLYPSAFVRMFHQIYNSVLIKCINICFHTLSYKNPYASPTQHSHYRNAIYVLFYFISTKSVHKSIETYLITCTR